MIDTNLKKIWNDQYNVVEKQLKEISKIGSVATAFNTNIDAVLKIKGKDIEDLVEKTGLSEEEAFGNSTHLIKPSDVVHGIFKCFASGIAEEWTADDKSIYEWMKNNLGYDRLQMGGQGGIVANALAVLGVKHVYAHTNSHPKIQADQFLNLDNLFAFDEKGNLKQASKIDRKDDIPLIHWIIEFDVGDKAILWGKEFVCPKSNRFIATYDPLNADLVINQNFVNYLSDVGYNYLILSGYSNLTTKRKGVELVKNSATLIESWKKKNPDGIIHLEVASTQDKLVRKAVVEEIAPLVDSIGLNERETLDVLEVIDENQFEELRKNELTAPLLFKAILDIKQKIKVPRIQLHMFGLYITVQDKNFKIPAENNLKGMMLAATVAATKAGTGKIEEYDNLLWAKDMSVSDVGLRELTSLAESFNMHELLKTGIDNYLNFEIIAVPTILIQKPLTLVGMGDTISSVSLIGAV